VVVVVVNMRPEEDRQAYMGERERKQWYDVKGSAAGIRKGPKQRVVIGCQSWHQKLLSQDTYMQLRIFKE
jgi:hypothetical protein